MSDTTIRLILGVGMIVSWSAVVYFSKEAWRTYRSADPWQRMRWPMAVALSLPNLFFAITSTALLLFGFPPFLVGLIG